MPGNDVRRSHSSVRTTTKQCSGHPQQLLSKCQRQSQSKKLEIYQAEGLGAVPWSPTFSLSVLRNLATASCFSPPTPAPHPTPIPPTPKSEKTKYCCGQPYSRQSPCGQTWNNTYILNGRSAASEPVCKDCLRFPACRPSFPESMPRSHTFTLLSLCGANTHENAQGSVLNLLSSSQVCFHPVVSEGASGSSS
ncbi:Hypothetical predicted protein [Marmota monax]|uniref:Uncharacterized protein n=1 Tax=Marmota monax TaxID=9995 RepID=A0A5E4CR08_MARMO|nr:hypothetical protein GHT09_010457 [Marmota monax]VTJ84234.1 Hypothetical predicted protein [Marmota monax]